MRAFEHPCTEPHRWIHAPDADAPEAEILAYLRHCDACAYHARLARHEDPAFDRLLHAASRDLDVAAMAHRLRRRDRAPFALDQRAPFERRLAQACLLAFGILVLWLGYASYQFGALVPAGPDAVATETPPAADRTAYLGQFVETARGQGRLYIARVISDAYDGQATKSGVLYDKEQDTAAAAGLPFGSRLLVVNPLSGASVEVTVVDRGPEEGRINLSASAARALGFEGKALVVVEVLSMPAPPALGP